MLKKSLLAFSFLVVCSVLFSFKSEPQQQVLKTIIIDAGHGIRSNGGYDGAHGAYSYEDDIALAISKKLVDMIHRDFPEVKVVETRPTKYITNLHSRADIANQNQGDLFVSVHVNAMPPIEKRELTGYKTEVYYTGKGKSRKKHTRKVAQYRYYSVPNTSARGTLTLVWGSHKSEDKEIAVRENAPILGEDNYKEKYGDVDVNSPEFIALSLVKTQQFSRRSTTLASMVENEFTKAGRVSAGATQRQVGIWVLQATAMPSILVETGFITNPQEEEYLNSEDGQTQTATCIENGIKQYKTWLESRMKGTGSVPDKNTPSNSAPRNNMDFLNEVDRMEKSRAAR